MSASYSSHLATTEEESLQAKTILNTAFESSAQHAESISVDRALIQEDVWKALRRNSLLLAKADDTGMVVGAAVLSEDDSEIELQWLGVQPDLKRHGIGRRLLTDTITHARHQGKKLIIKTYDEGLKHYFEKHGAVYQGLADDDDDQHEFHVE